MDFTWDPIVAINLMLCLSILFLGIWGNRLDKHNTPILIGIAFGIFAISHILTLLGLRDKLETFLIVIRTAAYLIVIFSLFLVINRGEHQKEEEL